MPATNHTVTIVIAVITVVLLLVSLVDVLRRKTVRGGHRWIWIVVIVVLGLPGQALYFLFGRTDD